MLVQNAASHLFHLKGFPLTDDVVLTSSIAACIVVYSRFIGLLNVIEWATKNLSLAMEKGYHEYTSDLPCSYNVFYNGEKIKFVFAQMLKVRLIHHIDR